MFDFKHFLILLLSFIASIIIGIFLPSWSGFEFDKPDQVLATIGLFLVFLLLDIFILIIKIDKAKEISIDKIMIKSEFDKEIVNIQNCFSLLTEKQREENDLFVKHFQREVNNLYNTIFKASHEGELYVESHHFSSVDEVIGTFLGEKNPVHRSVWAFSPGEKLFEISADLEYFRLLVEAANDQKIKGVRTLFVVSNIDDLNDFRLSKLLDFYKNTKRFDCRIVLKDEYSEFIEDQCLAGDFEDFGIYGERQLFLTKSYSAQRTGMFVRDNRIVRSYIDFFDKVWQSKRSKHNVSNAKYQLTIDKLIELDSIDDGEE